ncbi:MAG: hypothetical protein JW783_03985 [Bacteroidales bacterium]|nr:hypothetical protein [Bacteroidales bacterium]MBN2748548.1 hypothetical protein [Bacteroidales bacterium]
MGASKKISPLISALSPLRLDRKENLSASINKQEEKEDTAVPNGNHTINALL